jgi:nicotinamidase-related amidase
MERGSNPALLLVDVYRGVFGDEPQPLMQAMEDWPASCGLAGWAALPRIKQLLLEARSAGIPVVHITGTGEIPHWRSRPGRGEALTEEAAERRRRHFDIVDEVAPIAGEVVIRKAAPSAFFGTPLASYLNQLRVDSVIVSGESTSGCVRATVVDASSYRFDVVVVEECVFDRHEAAHAINLFDMDQKYADVLGIEETIAYLRGSGVAIPQSAGVP